MITYKTTVPATVIEPIQQHKVIDPTTQKTVTQHGYKAVLQYVRKAPEVRLVLCSSLEEVEPDETVFVSYHNGMNMYQHNRYTTVSDCAHCDGGFYYLNGESAE